MEAPAADPTPRAAKRNPRAEWEEVLLESMERNALAPTDEVILHAFDLYRDILFEPVTNRRMAAANLYAEIVAKVAKLQALVPGLVERAGARHPFEFSRIIDHKEE